jgi:HSP20 family molecular chaperone IbpA
MPTFLDRLRKRNIDTKGAVSTKSSPAGETLSPPGTFPVSIDIKRTPTAFVVFAQVPGAEPKDIEVVLEKDNDILVIQGSVHRPVHQVLSGADAQSVQTLNEECKWGQFFRRIILPEEVRVNGVEAKVMEGVLTIILPLPSVERRADANRIRVEEGQ